MIQLGCSVKGNTESSVVLLSILLHGDGDDLFKLPSFEARLLNENHINLNLLGKKPVPVQVIKACSRRRSIAQIIFILGAR